MECELENRQELISRYLAGGLTEKEAEVFEEHYFQCEICFEELKAAEEAVNLIENEGKSVLNLKDNPETKGSFGFVRKLSGNQGRMNGNRGPAVSFAIVIFAVILLAVLLITIPTNNDGINGHNDAVVKKENSVKNKSGENEKTDREKSGKESLPGKIQEEQFAANLKGPDFTPNPYMEEWSTENLRSVNEKLDKVISPATGEKFQNKDIIFKWTMIQNEPVTVKILTNKEKEVYSKSPAQGSFPQNEIRVSPEVFKHPGLYYWRIEDEEEVIYIGKFYFLK
ncbi:MAG TPA: zf-HC2 domain-containing protein [Ignavibacteriaceae bacterium]|nr:zf-HC2 domain-containing protein [Ignavibacteriaceae bacterium]